MARGRSIKNKQLSPELLAVIVDGTGTAALSGLNANDCTLTDNGTGDYTITFDEPFKCADTEVVVVATNVTDDIVCKIGTVSKSAVQILTENLSGTATDADFHVMIMGSHTSDRIG